MWLRLILRYAERKRALQNDVSNALVSMCLVYGIFVELSIKSAKKLEYLQRFYHIWKYLSRKILR